MTPNATSPLEAREERKVVTALFADLVGSTSLIERLHPEEARLIVTESIARMIGAVEEFGGTVKDLAGDGVLALFGAPVAHEDDPERAVRAGLKVAQEIAGYAGEVEAGWGIEGFGVRVGVDTGATVVGLIGTGSRVEYGVTGDAVNIAARLQSHAEPGTVLVGESAYRSIEPLFRWGPPRDLELKGKGEPVRAYPALSALPSRTGVRGLPGLGTGLIGREQDVRTAETALHAVLEGSGGVVFITGEAGIGKSRLTAEIRDRAEHAAGGDRGGPLWIEGRSVSYGESIPYWPFRDLLRSWLGVSFNEPDLRVRVALRRRIEALFAEASLGLYPYLAAMLGLTLEPDAASRLADLSPEALQYRTFEVVQALLERLGQEGPVVVVLEDLHWADPTSIQLCEQLLGVAEVSAVLLILTGRPERDHPFWRVKEAAARLLPHLTTELALEALSGQADRQLLSALIGPDTLPPDVEVRVLQDAEGNPFYLEELVRSLIDAGALVREGDGWRFDHAVPLEIPRTVENVILARIDRLSPPSHRLLMAASVLGRQFGLPLLEGAVGPGDGVREPLHDLQRLDLIRESRRWPEPEYRFKHALIQEAAYRTLVTTERVRLHRRAAEWLEERHGSNVDEVAGLLAHHWLAAEDTGKAITYLALAGDRARQDYALDEAVEHYRNLLPLLEDSGDSQAVALVLFKLALALHTSMRFGEANAVYQRAFDHWTPPVAPQATPTETLRMSVTSLPRSADPAAAGWWPDIELCMQLFDRLVEAWPERTIVPALADRWEISDDGLRYVFHLRHDAVWSDGHPLTAHDVEFGIKRSLDPDQPGANVSIYFVLENGQEYYLGQSVDSDAIGVRALDDHTVEFRLTVPAPYFMSVVNRPDAGPQPRHATERHGESWTELGRQVVSGPFEVASRTDDLLVLRRRPDTASSRPRSGNVAWVEYVRTPIPRAIKKFERGEVDVVRVRYTPRTADHLPEIPAGASVGPAAWSAFLGFDHLHPVLSNVDLRRALAHAVDRDALEAVAPPNLLVATGGLVPPALQGHTPDIVLRFDPDLARMHLERSGQAQALAEGLDLAAYEQWSGMLEVITASWREILGLQVRVRTWSASAEPSLPRPLDLAPIVVSGWLPGYPDPEYYLRLLVHSDAFTNEGRFADAEMDRLIEEARHQRDDRSRLELFHQADRLAVAGLVAVIPLAYGRSMALVGPAVDGWWEFGKTSAPYADLRVNRDR